MSSAARAYHLQTISGKFTDDRVNGVGPDGSTALVMLATVGGVPETLAFLAAGANVNISSLPFYEFGEGPGDLAWFEQWTPLMAAAARTGGSDGMLQALVGAGASDNQYQRALELACKHNNVRSVRYLLSVNASPSHVHGTAPIYIAAERGHARVINVLLEHKADPCAWHPAVFGRSAALSVAICNNHASAVIALLQHGATRHSALFEAIAQGDLHIVSCVLRYKASPLEHTDVTGATALHVAARRNNPSICRLLLDANADPNAREKWVNSGLIGPSVIHHAAECRGVILKMLIISKADVNTNWSRTTPLMLAAKHHFTENVAALIEAGADASKRSLVGHTAGVIAVTQGEPDECLPTIKLLAAAGAPHMVQPEWMPWNRHPRLVRWQKATLNWAPLQHIAANGWWQLGEQLRKHLGWAQLVGTTDNMIGARRQSDTCIQTKALINQLTSGWSPKNQHPAKSDGHRQVYTIMLVSARMYNCESPTGMPPEMWLHCLQFLMFE
jgi:ankyrin repeat protein